MKRAKRVIVGILILGLLYGIYIGTADNFFLPKCLALIPQVNNYSYSEYTNDMWGMSFKYPDYMEIQEKNEQDFPTISAMVGGEKHACFSLVGQVLEIRVRVHSLDVLNERNNRSEDIGFYLNRNLQQSRDYGVTEQKVTLGNIRAYKIYLGVPTNISELEQLNDYVFIHKDNLIHLSFYQSSAADVNKRLRMNPTTWLGGRFRAENEKIKSKVLDSMRFFP